MKLTPSFVILLQHFTPVFTTTFRTFAQIVTRWILSHRHSYITDSDLLVWQGRQRTLVSVSSLLQPSSWDIDALSMLPGQAGL